ncbi:MAG: HDIG domain-containing protein [Bacteroidia bacterium]
MNTTTQAVVDEIFALFDLYGDDSYGEEVTQLEHMVQSAELAEEEGYDEEVIIAAFLHDIGHLYAKSLSPETFGEYGAADHDRIGAEFLRTRGFSEKVAALVEGHVAAKRYLTFTEPGYLEELSEASKKTLEMQGGVMTEAEAEAFEASQWFKLSLRMRYWDEAAKEIGMDTPDTSYLRDMMARVLGE